MATKKKATSKAKTKSDSRTKSELLLTVQQQATRIEELWLQRDFAGRDLGRSDARAERFRTYLARALRALRGAEPKEAAAILADVEAELDETIITDSREREQFGLRGGR